ncbi:hypothetical protein [Shewanella sp.]|uniref:hypothetical protein n=1 Tax=Shewanella sp. TaxID=50422 RepID=UPI004053E238
MLSIYQCVAAKLTSQNRTQAVITMPIWQYLYASLLLLLLCPETIASDESWQQLVEQVELQDPQTHEAPKLKLGKPLVLDNQGQRMEHKAADDIEVGLEFRTQDAADLSERSKLPQGKQHKKSATKNRKKKNRTQSRKQQLASRKHVANDVSCRWLNSRMDHLEGQLKQSGTQGLGHQAAELKIRKKEWQCLKCGVEGPSVADRSRCQHKR